MALLKSMINLLVGLFYQLSFLIVSKKIVQSHIFFDFSNFFLTSRIEWARK